MKNLNKTHLLVGVFCVIFLSNVTFAITPVLDYGDQYSDWFFAGLDPNNLLKENITGYTASGNFNPWNLSPLGEAVLNDGIMYVWSSQFAAWGNNYSIEYDLDCSVNTYGYDISSIKSYGGWPDSGRDSTQYTVYYSVVDNPSWISLGTIDYNPSSPVSWSLTRATWPTNLQNVDAIKFVAPASTENGGNGMSEFVALGTPSSQLYTISTVDAGPDQNVWLDNGTVDVFLDGTVTSTGSYTLLWSDVNEPAGSTVVFTPETADVEDLVVQLDMVGTYVFELTAIDGNLNPSATMTVMVYDESTYENACAFAQDQPGFEWEVGDINSDCEVNLLDFVDLSANWLDCYHPDCL